MAHLITVVQMVLIANYLWRPSQEAACLAFAALVALIGFTMFRMGGQAHAERSREYKEHELEMAKVRALEVPQLDLKPLQDELEALKAQLTEHAKVNEETKKFISQANLLMALTPRRKPGGVNGP